MPLNIDFSAWPIWLVAILLVINLFKNPLGRLVGFALPKTLEQHLKNSAKLESERIEQVQETRKYDQARRSWREDNLMDILKEKDAWERETLQKQITDLTCVLNANTDQMHEVSRAITRFNDLLVNLNMVVNQMSDILQVNRKNGATDGQAG